MSKIPFTMRLDLEIVDRLKKLALEQKMSHCEVVALALAALEREQKTGDSLPARLAYLEKNIAAFFDLVMTFNGKLEEKFAVASQTEKNRMKGLLKLLEIKIAEHDDAEAARLQEILQALCRQAPLK